MTKEKVGSGLGLMLGTVATVLAALGAIAGALYVYVGDKGAIQILKVRH